ncbi:MAG: hypothetical protein AVDCRST_MAG71-2856, partial [uncultured Lysobacter sp.]
AKRRSTRTASAMGGRRIRHQDTLRRSQCDAVAAEAYQHAGVDQHGSASEPARAGSPRPFECDVPGGPAHLASACM